MGREGIAFTFVTPEQGIELTRIEMLINKLLERDEIEGFITVAQAAPPQAARAPGSPAGEVEAALPAEPPKPAPPPPPGKRAPRRHRRGL
jgi:ATP-dependent RNA helicase DeaD